ncbi:hypothetical protein OG381_47790 [Streptomyces sp. NBC_00490]|uniref:hypothetical protein n=1 Tax=Streptomyces sp. NBC_00490 TaxID=2903657 RepID=UPI002E176966
MRHLIRKYCAQLIALGVAVPLLALGIPAASAATTASVSIDAGRTLATFPETGVGMNVAVYDAT